MHEKCRSAFAPLMAALALAVLSADAGAAIRIKRTLKPTGVDANAQGQALVVINHQGGRGKLLVKGHKLNGSATFGIRVGGVRIGTLTTNPAGNGHAKFSSRPGPRDQMLGVDPRGKLLEVEDESGEDVLDDDIPDDSIDPNAVACCLPDGDETECETLTPDECQHEGGTDGGAASCMPDPCPTTAPEEIRCCVPDDSGADCEEATAAECSDHNGTNIGSGACDPNPCAPSTPGVERCCIPEQDQGDNGGDNGGEPQGAECEQLTAEHCAAEGGTSSGDGSCDPNPCASPSGAFIDGSAHLF